MRPQASESPSVSEPERDCTLCPRLLRFRADGVRQKAIGRQLVGRLRQLGLVDISVEGHSLIHTDYAFANSFFHFRAVMLRAVDAGVLELATGEAWLSQLEAMDQVGAFFQSGALFLVSGRKPT